MVWRFSALALGISLPRAPIGKETAISGLWIEVTGHETQIDVIGRNAVADGMLRICAVQRHRRQPGGIAGTERHSWIDRHDGTTTRYDRGAGNHRNTRINRNAQHDGDAERHSRNDAGESRFNHSRLDGDTA